MTFDFFGLLPLQTNADAMGAPFFHDQALVGVSMLVSVAGAYAFLELAGRAKAREARARIWLAASGAMLGFGVWATHFIGLLAFESPLERGFEISTTAASAAIGVLSGVAALLLAGPRPTWRLFAAAGAGAALGAIVMHYIGMSGLRIEAALSYRPLWVALTALGAVGAAVIALLLAHRLDASWMRAVAAFPAGAGIAGLHYLDMAATIITPRPVFEPPSRFEPWIALITTTSVVLVIAAALLAVMIDRRRSDQDYALGEHGRAGKATPSRSRDESENTIVYVPDVLRRDD